MQKKSRFLTGLLSAVMALTLFALPATAAEDTETGGTPTVSVSDNWTQNTGSIVIHKYEYNGKQTNKGTGETTDNLPTDDRDMKPLEGAGFTAYQVMDRKELAHYYDGLGKSEDKVDVNKYLSDGKINNSLVEKTISEVKTNNDGTATFGGLDLGLYVIVETTTPDKVTGAVTPFLVSIPMTQQSNPANWMYTVNVYPKNSTTYGKITLKKVGKTGKKDDGNLNGVTFTLDKLESDGKTWSPVTAPANGGDNYVLTTANGQIELTGLTQGTYRLKEVGFNTDTAYIVDTRPIIFKITSEGKLKINGEEKADATITVVNNKPDLDKEVVKNNTPVKAADYSVGDEVPYQLTVTVPNNITDLKTFNVVDTPKNLADKVDTIAVKWGDKVVAEYSAVAVGQGFEITFKPAQMANYAGETLTITYKATLLGTADVTDQGNSNAAKLVYTSKIGVNATGNPEEEGKKEIHDGTVVYSFQIKVYKTADDTKKPLKDVEFDLYKEVAANSEENLVTGTAAKALGLNESKSWKKINNSKLKTDDNGVLTQPGLANGDYYLVETKTVAGYNLLSAPVKVTLNINATTEWNYEEKYEEGNLIRYDVNVKKTTFDGENGTTAFVVKVINRKGFNLPTTGGFGTLLFSGIGALLVVGGVGVLMGTKKKKDNA